MGSESPKIGAKLLFVQNNQKRTDFGVWILQSAEKPKENLRVTSTQRLLLGATIICVFNDLVEERSGGRDRDRTCDPYDVNVVLSR